MILVVGSLVVVVRELDVRVVVVDEGEVGVDEGQCVEHGKDSFTVPRLKYLFCEFRKIRNLRPFCKTC